MAVSIKAIKDRIDSLHAEEDAIFANNDTLSAEHRARLDEIAAEQANLQEDLTRATAHADRQRVSTPVTLPAQPRTGQAGPFQSLGEQFRAIAMAAKPGARPDERLMWEGFADPNFSAGPTGSNESIGSDGGFAVQSDFVPTMIGSMFDPQNGGEILSRLRRFTVGPNSNGTKMYGIDEKSRQNGQRFGGLQVGWIGEGDPFSATKPKFREIELPLRKLGGLWYATDELIADAAMLTSYVPQMFQSEMTFVLEDSVLNGFGVASPLGIFNSGALITVPKDPNQAAGTITQNNILNIWMRVTPSARKNGAWYISQDAEGQLYTLFTPVLNGGNVVNGIANPLVSFIPAGVNGSQYPLLMGKPVIVMEQMAPLGTSGDIMFADMSTYFAVDKGGLNQASSIHVRFAYDEMAYRFVYRFNGQPLYSTPLTPYRGTNTISPFVTLATRS